MKLDQQTVDEIYVVLTRRPISYGQMTLFKALYDAEGEWVSKPDLSTLIRGEDEVSLTGVMRALGKRINATKTVEREDRIGTRLLLDKKRELGILHYRMSEELKYTIESIPGLVFVLSLTYPEIRDKYRESWWANPRQQRIDLGLYD